MEFKNTQDLLYVGFKTRFVAFVLDYLLIGAYILVLLVIGFAIQSGPSKGIYQKLFTNPVSSEISAFVLLTLPVILYFAISESSKQRATWGKKRMHIQVIRNAPHDDGKPMNMARSLLRSGIKFLPWELTHYLLWQIPGWPFKMGGAVPAPSIDFGFVIVYVLVFLYFLSVIVGKAHRSIYDRISGSLVIATRK